MVAELCRGVRFDPPVRRAIRTHRLVVPTLEFEDAVSIGNLLGKAALDSSHMVDASVISVALQDAAGVVLTGDKDDLEYLGDQVHTRIRVIGILSGKLLCSASQNYSVRSAK
ncbi:MAG TPA: hypothetical protein PKB15_04685 [Acidimicrobiia bacterium]|nr:hypothetical protein [Acidimicrobiia bacterium]